MTWHTMLWFAGWRSGANKARHPPPVTQNQRLGGRVQTKPSFAHLVAMDRHVDARRDLDAALEDDVDAVDRVALLEDGVAALVLVERRLGGERGRRGRNDREERGERIA